MTAYTPLRPHDRSDPAPHRDIFLTLRPSQSVSFSCGVVLTVLDIDQGAVALHVSAPPSVRIDRGLRSLVCTDGGRFVLTLALGEVNAQHVRAMCILPLGMKCWRGASCTAEEGQP